MQVIFISLTVKLSDYEIIIYLKFSPKWKFNKFSKSLLLIGKQFNTINSFIIETKQKTVIRSENNIPNALKNMKTKEYIL